MNEKLSFHQREIINYVFLQTRMCVPINDVLSA